MYRVLPCFHGVCVVRNEHELTEILLEGKTSAVSEALLLPGGIECDHIPDAGSLILPACIEVDNNDLKNLQCTNPENFSFTHYGPEGQDKTTNQDFALSGRYFDGEEISARFGIVADGISNGFAFPQRGAQISCFVAYKVLKNFHRRKVISGQHINDGDVQDLRKELVEEIALAFHEDHEFLRMNFVGPQHISPRVWNEYFRGDPRRWYGNTLIVSYVSCHGALVLYSGDGGILLLKDGKDLKEIQRSEEGAISQFIKFDASTSMIRGACIEFEDYAEIITVTDGVDRTFQLNEMPLHDEFKIGRNLPDIIATISDLANSFSGEIDVDNYSISRIFFGDDPQFERLQCDDGAKIIPIHQRVREKAFGEDGGNEVGAGSKGKSFLASRIVRNEFDSIEEGEKKKSLKMMDWKTLLIGLALGIALSNSIIMGLSLIPESMTQAPGLDIRLTTDQPSDQQTPTTEDGQTNLDQPATETETQESPIPLEQEATGETSTTTDQPSDQQTPTTEDGQTNLDQPATETETQESPIPLEQEATGETSTTTDQPSDQQTPTTEDGQTNLDQPATETETQESPIPLEQEATGETSTTTDQPSDQQTPTTEDGQTNLDQPATETETQESPIPLEQEATGETSTTTDQPSDQQTPTTEDGQTNLDQPATETETQESPIPLEQEATGETSTTTDQPSDQQTPTTEDGQTNLDQPATETETQESPIPLEQEATGETSTTTDQPSDQQTPTTEDGQTNLDQPATETETQESPIPLEQEATGETSTTTDQPSDQQTPTTEDGQTNLDQPATETETQESPIPLEQEATGETSTTTDQPSDQQTPTTINE